MDWTKIVDPICKVLRLYSAVPCNFFDQENARPLPLRDFNVNLDSVAFSVRIPHRSEKWVPFDPLDAAPEYFTDDTIAVKLLA